MHSQPAPSAPAMLTLADAVLLLQHRVGPETATHDGMQLAAWATQQYGVLAEPGSMPLCWLLLRLQRQARSNCANGLCYCGSTINNSSGCSSASCCCVAGRGSRSNSGAAGAAVVPPGGSIQPLGHVVRCCVCGTFDKLLQLPEVQQVVCWSQQQHAHTLMFAQQHEQQQQLQQLQQELQRQQQFTGPDAVDMEVQEVTLDAAARATTRTLLPPPAPQQTAAAGSAALDGAAAAADSTSQSASAPVQPAAAASCPTPPPPPSLTLAELQVLLQGRTTLNPTPLQLHCSCAATTTTETRAASRDSAAAMLAPLQDICRMQQGLSHSTAMRQVRELLTAYEVSLLIRRYKGGVQIKSSGRYCIPPQQAVQNLGHLLQLLRDVPEVQQQVDTSTLGAAVCQQQQQKESEESLSPAGAMRRMLEEAMASFEAAVCLEKQTAVIGACCWESDVPFIASRLRSAAAAAVNRAGGAVWMRQCQAAALTMCWHGAVVAAAVGRCSESTATAAR